MTQPFLHLLRVGALTALAASVAAAQPPPAAAGQTAPGAPTPQPPAAAPSYVVTSDAAAFLFFVKPDRELEFQEVVIEMRKALAASADPVRQAQAAGWKVFRAAEPPPPVPGVPPGAPASVVYVFLVSPAVASADYSPANLLAEALGRDVGAVWLKYRDAFAAPATKATLTLTLDFAR